MRHLRKMSTVPLRLLIKKLLKSYRSHITKQGYMAIYLGRRHPDATPKCGEVLLHRLVASKKIGRKLKPKEIVHHRDENRLNYDPSNLEVLKSRKWHKFHHRKEGSNLRRPDERNVIVKCSCGCGLKFKKYYDLNGRPRLFVHGHNLRINQKRQLAGQPNMKIKCKCGCGRQLSQFGPLGLPRMVIQGHQSNYRWRIFSGNKPNRT